VAATSYLIGLGSNRRHGRHGAPRQVIDAAVAALAAAGLEVAATSATIRSAALGSDRDFANAAVRVETMLAPPALLALLKRIERMFGRRRGRRWGARVLDLDILAWQGGAWPPAPRPARGALVIPHAALTTRGFALGPAATIAPKLRLPRTGRTLRQHGRVLRRPRPVDPRRTRA
jgi:2-amino-4-hydroxy-6-hydroxymethyldihydropteridine diphosphokinase